MYIIFRREILRVFVSWSCTHVIPGSNNECTPRDNDISLRYDFDPKIICMSKEATCNLIAHINEDNHGFVWRVGYKVDKDRAIILCWEMALEIPMIQNFGEVCIVHDNELTS